MPSNNDIINGQNLFVVNVWLESVFNLTRFIFLKFHVQQGSDIIFLQRIIFMF